jgi:hypothetical protein
MNRTKYEFFYEIRIERNTKILGVGQSTDR